MKKKGAVLISVRDSDKQEAIRIGERFEALGFDIYATSGTANVLNRHMVATNAIRNVDEPSPNIIDLIESGKIDYVIATSVKGRHPELGSVHIRRTAVERAIPCLTSMDTVSAPLRCLEGDIKIENCGNDRHQLDLTAASRNQKSGPLFPSGNGGLFLLCCTVLCSAVLCCTLLYCAVLCCPVLCVLSGRQTAISRPEIPISRQEKNGGQHEKTCRVRSQFSLCLTERTLT
ncbi:MAG: hypothetical protein ACLR4Z_11980 [Butyricicoccaceae bacterium]